ncbi:MAG TPA: hypothetical protein VMI75_16865, partial [Polyangiaceae bacterium]|nr:hypothetical protein [Polyangiaceae bacterium]
GKLLDLQNGVFQQTGAVSRRWGYSALGKGILGTSSMVSACAAVNAFNDELLLYDGANAYSYIEANDAWAQRGSIVSIVQNNQQIVRNDHQQLSPDMGATGGVELYAWEDSRGGIRYSVFDQASGTAILTDQPLYPSAASTDIRPKVLAWNGLLYVLFAQASGCISYVTVNPLAPATTPVAAQILLSGLPTPIAYDAAVQTLYNPPQLCVAYDGPTNVQISTFVGSPSTAQTWVAPLTTIGSNDRYYVGAHGVSSVALGWVVALAFGSGIVGVFTVPQGGTVFTPSGPVEVFVAANANAISCVEFASATGFNGFSQRIFVDVPGSSTTKNLIYTFTCDQTFTFSAPVVFLRSVGLASKPFSYAGIPYVNVAFESEQQSTYFTVNFQTGDIVSKVNAGLGGGLIQDSDYQVPECVQVSPGVFKYANLVKGLPNTEGGTILSLLGVNATRLDFADTNHFLSEAINGGFYTVGGILQSYDGVRYVESGFHIYPEGVTSSTSSSGGSMGSGTFDYAVTYEWTDNTGAILPSTPSPIVSVTIASGSTNSVTLTIPTLRLTKKTGVRIVVYRTAANGTLLYRVTSAIAPVYNDPTVDTVSFTDTLADASITSNGLMYTQPLAVGSNPVLPNDAPPACSLIAAFDDRLVLGGLDDGYTILPSQQSLANVPMQFSLALAIRVDPDGGTITALARMDDKLVIFKESAIFYLAGSGPDATGANSQWGDPVGVPSGGVGCVNPNSVVLSPIGLLFQSSNGIYLLDRGLNVTYKGAPVEAFTSPAGEALALNSATLLPNQWVVFTTESGTALVYDFFYDQWSTFTNHSAVDSDLYLGGGNTLVWAKSDGTVYEQTPTSFTDDGQPIAFSLTTAWINPGTIQGYQRVYHGFLLGTYKGDHTLNVWCGFDYDDAFTALAPIPVTSALGLSAFGAASPFGSDSPFGGHAPGDAVYQFRLDVLRKCQSIRFQISDVQSDPGNEGFTLSALTLVLGVKTGGNKVPAFKQFGVA